MQLSENKASIVGTSLLLALAALIAFVIDVQAFLARPLALGSGAQTYIVKPGASMKAIAQDLERAGIVDRPLYLVAYARWHGQAQAIRAGEYSLQPGLAPADLLRALVEGKVMQHSLTIVEGWTFTQLRRALETDERLQQTLQGLGDAAVMAKLGHAGEHPEGRFLPDTYHFPRGLTDLEFLRRAYAAMERYLAGAWERRAPGLPLRSPYEALILASIVEKETGLATERPQISGVFTRRLKQSMLLQTDPTIIYGLGQRFDGNLRRNDLRQDNPYNTYTRAGLPPTPIALPGRDAITAVLHPASGTALYFVSRGDGGHVFSATLEEHNRAVSKYQLGGRRAAGKEGGHD